MLAFCTPHPGQVMVNGMSFSPRSGSGHLATKLLAVTQCRKVPNPASTCSTPSHSVSCQSLLRAPACMQPNFSCRTQAVWVARLAPCTCGFSCAARQHPWRPEFREVRTCHAPPNWGWAGASQTAQTRHALVKTTCGKVTLTGTPSAWP